jgi:hypothetical protein
VKTDDRRSEGGGDQDQQQANVVRLPRDWLGPREELVPIGAAGGGPPRSASDPEAGAPRVWPPTAHDFWGEDSAALHDAMQAPPEAEQSVAWTAEHARSIPRPRPRTLRWAAAVTASAAALALVVSLIGGSADPSRSRPTLTTARTSKLAASTPLAGSDPVRDRSRAVALRLMAAQGGGIHRRPRLRARQGRPHRAPAHPSHHASPAARPRITPATEPVDQGATPAYTADAAGASQPSGTSGDQSQASSSDAGAAGHSASSEPAGPNGRVSLIGSGTSPSG